MKKEMRGQHLSVMKCWNISKSQMGHALKNILKRHQSMINGVLIPNISRMPISTYTTLELEASTPNLFGSSNFIQSINDGEQMVTKVNMLHSHSKNMAIVAFD
jgi:hypothetical protein